MTTWRRHHGDKLVAHVGHDEISGLYRVVVWCEGKEQSVTHLSRSFEALDSAKAAADSLARQTFKHRCSTLVCGQWMIWTAS
jgi:hypothetical protein